MLGFWSSFLELSTRPDFAAFQSRLSEPRSRWREHYDMIIHASQCMVNSILRGHVTVELWEIVRSSYRSFAFVWDLVKGESGEEFTEGVLTAITGEVGGYQALLKRIVAWLGEFLPQSEELAALTSHLGRWVELSVVSIRSLFTAHQPADHLKPSDACLRLYNNSLEDRLTSIDVAPMPIILWKLIDWLDLVKKCELFKLFWKEQGSADPTVADISMIAGRWSGFLLSILSDSLTYDVLDRYAAIVITSNEDVVTFVRTATAIESFLSSIGDHSADIFTRAVTIPAVTDAAITQRTTLVRDKLQQWSTIRDFYTNKDAILYILSISSSYIEDTQNHSAMSAELTLKQLCHLIESSSIPWADQTLALLPVYWKEAQSLDTRLLRISHTLLKVVLEKAELLDWLRGIANDDDFSSSIEMARSLQEMNTPLELWDAKSGRVNERYLSMISNIRGYLHSYLYEVDKKIPSFDTFLSIFSGFNVKTLPKLIIENIYECYEIRVGLSKVIGVKTGVYCVCIYMYSLYCICMCVSIFSVHVYACVYVYCMYMYTLCVYCVYMLYTLMLIFYIYYISYLNTYVY